jgi:hypothetical protein
MKEDDEIESTEPKDSDEDVEIRYQGLIDIYKDGRFAGETGDLKKLTVACFKLYNRVRSDPSQFSGDDLVGIITAGYIAVKWLDRLLYKCDRELNRAD